MPTIKLRRKTNAAGAPTSLADGEVAVNQSEGCIYGVRGSAIAKYASPLQALQYLDRDPVDETVTLLWSVRDKIEITAYIHKVSSGSLSFKVVKNDGSSDSDIHSATAVSVTTSKTTTTVTSSNVVDAGNVLKVTISSASTPKNLELQISYRLADLGINSSEG